MRAAEEARAAATARGMIAAIDTRDFEAVRRHLGPVVEMDYASLWGGEPQRLEADQVLDGWRSIVTGFDATRHDLGPLRTAVGGSVAEITCPVDARHFLDGRVWRVAGAYRIGLTLIDAWRVTAMRFELAEEEGDRALVDLARARAARRP